MFSTIVISPSVTCCANLAIAAARAGESGVLHLGFGPLRSSQLEQWKRLESCGHATWGIRWDCTNGTLVELESLLRNSDRLPHLLVLHGFDVADYTAARLPQEIKILADVCTMDSARQWDGEVDGLILSGNEAGGQVGNDSSYIFLQKAAQADLQVPYFVRGGIGPDSAAAAIVGGAAGIVLEEQLWLASESSYEPAVHHLWQGLDGSETECVGSEKNQYRVFSRMGTDEIKRIQEAVINGDEWLDSLSTALADRGPITADKLIALGQGIAFAHGLADQHGSVAGILTHFRKRVRENRTDAASQKSLIRHSDFSSRNGCEFPILQGPMTRVSDVPPFAAAVQSNGAIPFLALSLMTGSQVAQLLEQAQAILESGSWGVGILGFVPPKLREEQIQALEKFKPTHAIIAGGRPAQALQLEASGISTFLHVPSPGLLKSFFQEGCRKFIFEGRECGGHVGPRSSFLLWQMAVSFFEFVDAQDLSDVELVFAGGIHDEHSAAMVAAMAAPVVKRGAKMGLLMGTSYLFTDEAVSSGAIGSEFQNQALRCNETALLDSGNGHQTRAVHSPFVKQFNQKKQDLLRAGRSPSETRHELEMLNIGRLRIAAKGLQRADSAHSSKLVTVTKSDQIKQGLYMIGDVATLGKTVQPMRELHQAVTTGAQEFLEESVRSHPVLDVKEAKPAGEPVAVVGLGCIFPGAENVRQYWQNIYWQKDLLGEVPRDRWDIQKFYDEDRFKRDRVYAQLGSFIDEVIFDPTKYGIPPISLKNIEPIQLLALEVAEQALFDAGIQHSHFPAERTSVIFAAAGLHDLGISYAFRTGIRQHLFECSSLDPQQRDLVLAELEGRLPEWTEDSFAGFLLNVVAGRIANRFNLQGSNFTVDAACASSLAAVQAGVEQLRNHSCDAVLVGAVDGTNNPFTYMSFAKTQALSPGGRSRSLDQDADGIGLGEGVGAVVLKRLCDAEKSGDQIHAVLRGIGSSSDGRNRSMTAPYSQGQLRALRRAYQDADVSPSSVNLLELHSTGTKVGDQVEIDALTTLFQQHQASPASCAVGSIKSMVGHTKTAAGMASLLKVILSLNQHVIPPTLGVNQPIDRLADPDSPFYVSTKSQPWVLDSETMKRRAGVSCFGFGGTNFHAVLEEYSERSETCDLMPRDAEIFCWRRSSHLELLSHLQALTAALEKLDGDCLLAQLAYSSWIDEQSRSFVSSVPQACRLAVVASTVSELREQLHFFIAHSESGKSLEHPTGLFYSEADPVGPEQVCFVFPGQGSQQTNMLQSLVIRHQKTSEIYQTANQVVADSLDRSLSKLIFPRPVFSDEAKQSQVQTLNETRYAQPALAVTELFALQLLQDYGITASWFAGHSFGEYTALHAAGVIDADDFLRIAVARGQACWQCQVNEQGAMAAVFTDADRVSRLLRQASLNVSIANFNSDHQIVVAGEKGEVAAAIALMKAQQIRATLIPVTAAFHTRAMRGAQASLAVELQQTSFHIPRHTVYSNTTAEPFDAETENIKSLLNRQLTEPVNFQQQIQNMHEAGARIFVEVGPGKVLSNLIKQILGPHVPAYSIDSDGDTVENFARTLARLFVVGVPVHLFSWFKQRQLNALSVRNYFKQLQDDSIRKPTDWLVNSWRSRPFSETDQSSEALTDLPAPGELDPAADFNGGSDSSNGVPREESNGKKTVNPPVKVTKMRSVAELVKQTSQSRLAPNSARRDALNQIPQVHSKMTQPDPPESRSTDSSHASSGQNNLSQSVPHGMLGQMQSSMQKWLDLQAENQKAQARFLELQSEWLSVLREGGMPDQELGTPGQGMSSVIKQEEPSAESRPEYRASVESNGPAVNHSIPLDGNLPEAGFRNGQLPVSSPPHTSSENSHATNGTGPAVPHEEPRGRPFQTPEQAATTNGPADQASQNGKPATAEFRHDLLTAISERTGYPVDMLDEKLDLEGGLGIDSIKMVEIFSSLTKYHDYLPGADHQEDRLANFANQKTIQDIINFYESMSASDSPSSTAAATDPQESNGAENGSIQHLVLEELPKQPDLKKKSFPEPT